MPELPEVETVCRGISPHLLGKKLLGAVVRHHQMRLPLDQKLGEKISNLKVQNVYRRAKYLIIKTSQGSLLIHLGMSGSIRIETTAESPQKHDHVDFLLSNKKVIRLNDPRRFGLVVWVTEDLKTHPLLAHLGPEPLEGEFHSLHLFNESRKRRVPIKAFIMDNKVVVGVGNIYASEALFRSGIRPTIAANRINKERYALLTQNIKLILHEAIEMGGTTLRDFRATDGSLGYFAQKLAV